MFKNNVCLKIKKNRYWNRIDLGLLALVSIIFILILCLNFYVPQYNDDDFTYGYASNGIIKSIKFTILQYHVWDGRIATNLITSYLLQRGLSIAYFNVLNSIAFVIFVIFFINSSRYKINFVNLLLSLGVLAISFDDFGEIILWKTGSIQYLWGILIYIYIFDKLFGMVKNNQTKITVFDFIVSFVVAFWHQNLNIPFLLMGLYFLYKKNNTIIIYFIPYFIGSLVAGLAPGNFKRRDFVLKFQTSSQDLEFWYRLKHFILSFTHISTAFVIFS